MAAFGSECVFNSIINGFYCKTNRLAHLLFESLDADTFDRTVSPITISSTSNPSFGNSLNSFMDHLWDGFYTSQKRMSRFPTILIAGENITVDYTGTPPENSRFKYLSEYDSDVLQIKYPKAAVYKVIDNSGNEIAKLEHRKKVDFMMSELAQSKTVDQNKGFEQ